MKERLFSVLEQFAGKKVLVIGDIMLDKYIIGDVSRISPEAPIQVVHVGRENFAPAGASNTASNVAVLGGKAFLVGIVGDDEAKNTLFEELHKRHISTNGIAIDPSKPTIQKVRIVARGQQLLRFDYEKVEKIALEKEMALLSHIEKIVQDIDVIIISDYAKGVVTESLSRAVIGMARSYNKLILVDPKPRNKTFCYGVSLITPNLAEALEMVGSDEDVEFLGRHLALEYDTNVLITQGEKGMSLFEKSGSVFHVPAHVHEVYSVIGAGDTVIATLALALASGASLREASLLANIAAGVKVRKQGTATVSIDEIKKEIENLPTFYTEGIY